VALEATFRDLSVSLHHLHDALNALQITLGDKPPDDESAVADGLEGAVLDLMGTLHEVRKAALKGKKAVGHPGGLDSARRAITLCQERFHRIEQQFASDLVSYEKLRELARLGTERRPWVSWSIAVKQGIEQSRQPLEEVSRALARCWQEIAEHAGATSVSVRTTSVGQKIIARQSEGKDLSYERIT
jgi:hypothetical protein